MQPWLRNRPLPICGDRRAERKGSACASGRMAHPSPSAIEPTPTSGRLKGFAISGIGISGMRDMWEGRANHAQGQLLHYLLCSPPPSQRMRQGTWCPCHSLGPPLYSHTICAPLLGQPLAISLYAPALPFPSASLMPHPTPRVRSHAIPGAASDRLGHRWSFCVKGGLREG